MINYIREVWDKDSLHRFQNTLDLVLPQYFDSYPTSQFELIFEMNNKILMNFVTFCLPHLKCDYAIKVEGADCREGTITTHFRPIVSVPSLIE